MGLINPLLPKENMFKLDGKDPMSCINQIDKFLEVQKFKIHKR